MRMRKVMMTILMAIVTFSGAARADEVVIAALGDSLTQGYGLLPEDGFVPQLETWLTAQGAQVRLINAGVSGDTTAGGLARAAWTLTPDVDAIIVTLGGNDLLRGLDPAQARGNIKGILQAASDADVKVLLVGMKAPDNFGPEYKAQFDAIYPELAVQFKVQYFDSFFKGLDLDDVAVDAASLSWFQPDGIHPNAAGVARIVAGMGPSVLALVEAVNAED